MEVGGSAITVSVLEEPGRGARVDVGERDKDLDRVREATAAFSFSASWIRCRSRPKSRCRTVIARSYSNVSSIFERKNASGISTK